MPNKNQLDTPEDQQFATQVSKIVINAPIQKVWEALTKRGEVLPFFFGSVLETTGLAPGAPVRMRTPNGKYTGVVGEVLEFEPPRLYSMTFKFTNYDDPICKVTHELKEVNGGTEYTLTSSQIPKGTKTESQMKQGGPIITSNLKSVVETGKPTFMGRFIMIMGSLFAFMSPKSSLSTHWPLDKKVE